MTEPLAMCDFPPITADAPENYILENVVSPVGQIVTAYCKNTTVAIVKCLPNLTWNATVPSCPVKDRASDNMSTLLIILWVIGGILLFSLLILILIIITSKSKSRCASRGNGSQNPSIFHISGRSHGRGGDNPAFSRADEICGEWSYHRGDNLPESHRLPSYHEAIQNNYITVPSRNVNVSCQEVPVAESTTIRSTYENSDVQRSTTNLAPDITHHQNISERTETVNQIAGEQNTVTNQIHDITSNATVEQGESNATVQQRESNATVQQRESNNQTDSSRTQRNTQEETASTSRRYAENYPQCFFEEEPPPPYTEGPTNYPSHYPRLTRQNPEYRRERHLGRRRSADAVTSLHATSRQNEEDLLQNLNFRQSMYDRLVNNANSESMNVGHRRHTHIHSSTQSSNAADVGSRQNTRFDSRTVSKTSSDPSAHLSSNVICVNNHYSGSQLSRHSNENSMSGHSNGSHISEFPKNHVSGHFNVGGKHTANHTNTFQQLPNSATSTDAFQNATSISTVSNSNIYSTHQSYAPTIIFDDSVNNYITDNSRLHDPAIGTTRPTSTALPYHQISSTSHAHHNETLPLGTSTPVDQSPAEIRRFVPVNHPSPLSIPRNLPRHHTRQFPLQNYLLERDRCYTANINQEQQSVPRCYTANIDQEQQSVPHHEGSRHFPHVTHSAPLARFDGEYSTYL